MGSVRVGDKGWGDNGWTVGDLARATGLSQRVPRTCGGAACCATGWPPPSAPSTPRTVTAPASGRPMTPNCS
jgi:hypothetical protein